MKVTRPAITSASAGPLPLPPHGRRFTREEEGGKSGGVPVGRGSAPPLRRDEGVGAGPVLYEEGLAERAGHVLRDEARDHVGRPARREADQDLHRPRGIALRGRSAREGARRRRGESRECFFHLSSGVSGWNIVAITWQRLTRRCSPGP